MKRNALVFTFLFSLLLHFLILTGSLNVKLFDIPSTTSHHSFKIQQLRNMGSKDSVKKNLFAIKPQLKPRPKPSLKKLSFNEFPINKFAKKIFNKKKKTREFAVKNFLTNPIMERNSTSQIIGGLNTSELDIKFELPHGVPEDELNKRELVFYSFQKRTVQAYINSFVKELNDFKRKNPRTKFPLTKKKQILAGKISYDKNGDIIKIKTLAWTDIPKLQSFFMDVLKNISSIPNPPKDILENDQFVINFVLTLNDQ